ncbi:MAG: tRNA (adenosine(37)-N6)-threonylcarbamoyltransferase complex dimerization subunit type 1 TsaB [Chloroflexota bacterium]|nr:tRNA (adenosine(37)-N6)-threonylcarbamoyltransferase complex dimerization subunit type 1 TsaB [Dehalococcoidia bacterium]MDW8254757.1 tRNA (adenosine(37)-N6)-threonylcarbamoyltransferase complex dimerization subunit type 1 TsaB [Chloroflexota bacterium]
MILAIDTAGELTGLALWTGELCAELVWRSERRQTAELLPRLIRLLADSGHSFDDVRGLVVVTGPGSFNGIRVGIATAQGFALARRLPLVGVSLLEGMAWPYRALGRVGTVVAAGRDRAVAVFEKEGTGIATVLAPTIVSAAQTAGALTGCQVIVSAVGKLDEVDGPIVVGVAAHPRPGIIAELGAERLRAGVSGPVEPLYLRAPQITQPKAQA